MKMIPIFLHNHTTTQQFYGHYNLKYCNFTVIDLTIYKEAFTDQRLDAKDSFNMNVIKYDDADSSRVS